MAHVNQWPVILLE